MLCVLGWEHRSEEKIKDCERIWLNTLAILQLDFFKGDETAIFVEGLLRQAEVTECITAIYFINLTETKDKVNSSGSWTQTLQTNPSLVLTNSSFSYLFKMSSPIAPRCAFIGSSGAFNGSYQSRAHDFYVCYPTMSAWTMAVKWWQQWR